MSKPLHLVPHLNEMMEEYTEGGGGGGGGGGGEGGGAVQEIQSGALQKEERQEIGEQILIN